MNGVYAAFSGNVLHGIIAKSVYPTPRLNAQELGIRYGMWICPYCDDWEKRKFNPQVIFGSFT